ncbi:MAG: NnrS family protein, partial [Burkholderiaceae bacterium]
MLNRPEQTRPGLVDRIAARPLFCCSFRPLFLAAALQATIGMGLWLLFLRSGLLVPPVAGGPFAWHAHELVFGFGLAAVTGFVLTAAPEFTGTPAFGSRVALLAALLWLAARTTFWASGLLGPWPAALANVALAALPLVLVSPRILADPGRRHIGFVFGLAALVLVVGGYHVAGLTGADPSRWARLGISVMMALIVVALSRISVRIVNEALTAAWEAEAGAIDR